MNRRWRLDLHRLRLFAAALLLGCGVAALARQGDKSRVHVTWAAVETLSEVKENPARRGWLRPDDWMHTLGDYLRWRADSVLPPGEQLDVTITDIKLAGAFEPWHSSRLEDVRILKDIYPPRLSLHFDLRGADGTILRSGDDKLSDGAFLQRSAGSSTDPLRYDKRLIDDWLRKEFVRNKS